MKYILLIFRAITFVQTNTIKGSLAQVVNKEIALKGFTFKGDTLLATSKTNDKGSFKIKYHQEYAFSKKEYFIKHTMKVHFY